MPSELVEQVPLMKCSRCYGVKTVSMPGYEADDLLGTIARKK